MDLPIKGGCMCGAVRFELISEPTAFVACHCRECQYVSGGAPAFSLPIASDQIRMIGGEPKIFENKADSGNSVWRSFCPDCGTPLFAGSSARPERSVVKAGALDDPNGLKLLANVWTSSAPDWAHLDPAIPHFETNPA